MAVVSPGTVALSVRAEKFFDRSADSGYGLVDRVLVDAVLRLILEAGKTRTTRLSCCN